MIADDSPTLPANDLLDPDRHAALVRRPRHHRERRHQCRSDGAVVGAGEISTRWRSRAFRSLSPCRSAGWCLNRDRLRHRSYRRFLRTDWESDAYDTGQEAPLAAGQSYAINYSNERGVTGRPYLSNIHPPTQHTAGAFQLLDSADAAEVTTDGARAWWEVRSRGLPPDQRAAARAGVRRGVSVGGETKSTGQCRSRPRTTCRGTS